MSHNPYASPESNVAITESVSVYSPGQVAGGAFLGGPLGALYFLHANFSALQNAEMKKSTLLFGSLFALAIIVGSFFLPDNFPSTPINLAVMLVAQQVAERYQLSKKTIAESSQYSFHSNWRVVGFALLALMVTIALAIPLYFGLQAMGAVS
ncbi:MAG: hypothetical protein K0Q68_3113 [Moraxellaceae bacterium]|nr:hypothetical protein [Moraxellaceae bacterium]